MTGDRHAEFTIDGKTIQVSKGDVILIAAQSGSVRVKQLSRDESKLPLERDAVIAFGQADAEIQAFFAALEP